MQNNNYIEGAELKAFKATQKLSRETIHFTAKIYYKGKHIADVFNDGGGGSHQIDMIDYELGQEMKKEILKLPLYEFSKEFATPWDWELWITEEVSKHLLQEDFKSALRTMKKKLLLYSEYDNEFYTFAKLPGLDYEAEKTKKMAYKEFGKEYKILNYMSKEEVNEIQRSHRDRLYK